VLEVLQNLAIVAVIVALGVPLLHLARRANRPAGA
jgi:hypothetical protein